MQYMRNLRSNFKNHKIKYTPSTALQILKEDRPTFRAYTIFIFRGGVKPHKFNNVSYLYPKFMFFVKFWPFLPKIYNEWMEGFSKFKNLQKTEIF